MAIITLTTDLGSKDFYQAALKGSIVTLLPTVNIIDITQRFNTEIISSVINRHCSYT